MTRTLHLIPDCPTIKLAISNRKGGTGKTTVATNLAGELALRGYKVGLVDTDSQGHGSLYLGMGDANGLPEDNLFKALIGVQKGDEYKRVPLVELVREVPPDSYQAPFVDADGVLLADQDHTIGSLHILPGGVNTFRIPTLLDDGDLFVDIVDDFAAGWDLDILIIDTAPTIQLFDGTIYKAANAFLHVTQCEIGSMYGLREAYAQAQRSSARNVRQGLPAKPVIGIQPNLFRSLREHVENINDIANGFPTGLVWEPLRQLKAYSGSSGRGQTVRAFRPRSNEAIEISKMVTRVERACAAWLTK